MFLFFFLVNTIKEKQSSLFPSCIFNKDPVRGVCNFLSFVSWQQKFEAVDGAVLQLSFIQKAKENTYLRCAGRLTQKRKEKRSPSSSILAPY